MEVDGFVFKRKRQKAEQESSGLDAEEYQETEQSQIANPEHSACIPGPQLGLAPVDAATLITKAETLLSAFTAESDTQQILPGFCELIAQVSCPLFSEPSS